MGNCTFGPTKIIGSDYEIYCEKGNFDMMNSIGKFQKSKIFYNDKIIKGDSIFYNEPINFASATSKVKITDTINKSIIEESMEKFSRIGFCNYN